MLLEISVNLHEDGVRGILTDYEKKFMQEGVPIKHLIAVKKPETRDCTAGTPPRLRDAALADAYANMEEKSK